MNNLLRVFDFLSPASKVTGASRFAGAVVTAVFRAAVFRIVEKFL